MKKTLHVLYIIFAVLTILEYTFICGLFTGPIMMVCIAVIGLANLLYSLSKQEINEAVLYLLCTISLCIGYLKLMF